MDLTQYIAKVVALHAEFTAQEVQELCEDFLCRYKQGTKEETKHKAIKKFLTHEFGVSFDDHVPDHQRVFAPFVSIPKQYFQSAGEKSQNI